MLTLYRNELYKVLDSSDVVLHVLDARDPLGTRCRSVEKYLKAEAPHKHLIFVLNKCDLVPSSVAVSQQCSCLLVSQPFHPSALFAQCLCQDTFSHFGAAMGAICYTLGRANCQSRRPWPLGFWIGEPRFGVYHENCHVSIELKSASPCIAALHGSLLSIDSYIFCNLFPLSLDIPCLFCSNGKQAAWVRLLSKDHPCLAFHASINKSFGKGSLISLLRQFSTLHAKDRKEISIGLIG